MSLLFGKNRKKKEKTILLLDVENASVGGALVRLTPGQAPQLFAEKRIALPIFKILDSARLVHEVEKAVHEVLVHARAAAAGEDAKDISHIAVFLGAPWSTPSWKSERQGRARWSFEPYMQKSIARLAEDAPTSFHAFGTAATHAIDTAFEHDDAFLLCVVTGEVAEIMYIENNAIAARATMPFGTHTIFRTLASHAGVPLPAARSALNLIDTTPGRVHLGPAWVHEPLSVAATDFAAHFKDVAHELSDGAGTASEVNSILVLAPEPLGELFASILGNSEQMAGLFPQGGTVRALRAHHLVPHFAGRTGSSDLPLMTEALFIHKNF